MHAIEGASKPTPVVHTGAMLTAIAAVSLAVYNWIGVDFLRRGWINLDLIWIAALVLCGGVLLVV